MWCVLKAKVWCTCYNTSCTSHARDQKRFKMSENWHELMIPQRTMRPSVTRISEQLDPRFAASRHTTAPISLTIGLHPLARISYYSFPIWLRVGAELT